MGSLGVHFAINEDMAARLFAAKDDDVVIDLIEEVEEETTGVDHCDTDKAWDAIHRSLTDGLLGDNNGDHPLNAVTLLAVANCTRARSTSSASSHRSRYAT
ncbi:DUF1877 family protein [Micromonospora sp. BQ11]|uniref:DUF1877 family protein n=1 Tax=Micromonospora sp. BQ11 TaxID=3452212 RepID=UPI003F8A2A89